VIICIRKYKRKMRENLATPSTQSHLTQKNSFNSLL
jgi:hypothetical protein